MLNNQNSEKNLRRLKAQRVLYSSAKQLNGLQLFLSVFVVVALSLFVLVFNTAWLVEPLSFQVRDYSWLLASYGFLLMLIDLLIIVPVIESRKEMAAKIQQSFDSDVLSLGWNTSFYGPKTVDNEYVISWAARHKGDSSQLENWYSKELVSLPLEIQRIICQRTNCWWDSNVRKQYNYYLCLTGGTLFSILLAVSLIMNLGIQNIFVALLAPFNAFFSVCCKNHFR